MAIIWSGQSGRISVGIDVFTGGYDANSTQVTVFVDYWIRIHNWTYNDNQSLGYADPAPGLNGRFNFFNNKGSGDYKILSRSYTTPLNYGGGPTHEFYGDVRDAYDGSAPTLVRQFTIPARPPSVPVRPGIYVDSVTSNSARVGAIYYGDSGSPIIEWFLDIDDNDPNFGSPGNAATPGPYVFGGLLANTTYYVRSIARNGVGFSPYSQVISFRTGAAVPGLQGPPIISGVGDTSVTIGWGAPPDGGTPINNYEIQFAKDSGFTSGLLTYYDDATPFVFNGLSSATKYWVRTRAINAVGPAGQGDAGTFTTLTGTPVIVTPAEKESSPRGWPYAVIEAGGIGASDRTITVEWSDTSAFTAILHTVALTPTGRSSDNRYIVQDTTKKLPNGAYYVRARIRNIPTGYVTPNTPTRTYSTSHSPAVVPSSPAKGATVRYTATTPFVFQFTDPSTVDRLSAYQLVVENNATDAVVFDSGKTLLAGGSNPQILTINVAIPIASKGPTLRWRVKPWDRDDQPGIFSGYSIFTLSDPPIVNIQNPPNAGTVDNGSPTFAWTVSVPSGGRQEKTVVQVYSSTTNALIWSTTLIGTAVSATPPSIILSNGASYYVNVIVTDTTGLTTTATSTFAASYSSPIPPRYFFDGSQADNLGYINVDWTGSDADRLFAEWKLYRVNLSKPGTTWELIYRTNNQNVRFYHDYMIVSDASYSYSVTQVAYNSGVLLESPVGYYRDASGMEFFENRTTSPQLTHYWIVDSEVPDNSLKVPNVTSDDSTLEFESESFNVIGRGRHRDYGDELGYVGTLSCQVRTPERPSKFRLDVERMRRDQTTYYLRTPFGRLFAVALGNIGWNPTAGTGTAEMGEMTIPYEQVS